MKHLAASLAFAALSFAPAALADQPVEQKIETAKDDLKTKFFEIIDKESIKIGFDKGKARLTDGERSDLKSLVESLKADGTVQSYVVAAWSDKDYPATADAKLSAADRKLAEERQAAVVKALKKLGVKTVEGHSMAAHPTWVAKVFGSEDATVKGAKEANPDAAQSASQRIAEKLKDKGGPGTVVVIAKRAT